jgi:hypothetical protein
VSPARRYTGTWPTRIRPAIGQLSGQRTTVRLARAGLKLGADPAKQADYRAWAARYREDAERARTAREDLRRQAEAEGIVPPPARMSLRPGDDALIV